MMIRRRNRRRTRGAAYAEAVIMLPVFFVTLWGYQLLFQGYQANGEAMGASRSSAWEASMTGCSLLDGESTPTCEGAGCDGAGAVEADLGGDIPFLSSIINGLFGKMVGGGGSQDYDSGYTGTRAEWQREGTASATMRVVCNTKRETILGMIKAAICGSSSIVSDILDLIGGFCSGGDGC